MTARVRAATDGLVTAALARDMRDLGFSKRGRRWARRTDATHHVVTYRGSWTNTGNGGLFFVELCFAFQDVGHDLDGRIGPGMGFEGISFALHRLEHEAGRRPAYELSDVGDEQSVARVRRELERDWHDHGLPMLGAAATASEFAQHIAAHGNTETVRHAVDVVAAPLGNADLRRALVQRGLRSAASRDRWRHMVGDDHPLELGLTTWAWLIDQATDLGIRLEDQHTRAAAEVLADASCGMLATPYHTRSDERAATVVASHVDADVPAFAPMASGNEEL